VLLEGVWSEERKDALMASSDCYVSLHRSEGFGLTMAESMALGKPVIATAYSGNLDFMNPDVGYLVGYSETEVVEDLDVYRPGWRWAEPDLDEAAEFMRYVFEHREGALAVGRRGREAILSARSPAVAGAWVEGRLREIAGGTASPEGRAPGASAPSARRLFSRRRRGRP
jgi:glycosyltransferase involved in cell wall biosynthesis